MVKNFTKLTNIVYKAIKIVVESNRNCHEQQKLMAVFLCTDFIKKQN